MSLIKNKDLLNKEEIKKEKGYLTIDFTPKQWQSIRAKKINSRKVLATEKVYNDTTGSRRMNLILKKEDGKTAKIKVIKEEDITELIELFSAVNQVYAEVKYNQKYAKGKELMSINLEEYDVMKADEKEDEEDIFS